MCGIAGFLAVDPARDVTPAIERLTESLAHRGPDGCGYRFLRGRSAAFGHRRLSIVDLESGQQPMTNEDGRVWVVLNGELYNHAELRRDLEDRGHRFRTRSDVEALVHGWEEWGPGVLERLNGIYAFALFDGRDHTVWLARDPVGVKPLYVGRAPGCWWFASELSGARRAGLVDSALRPEAFDEYLVFRFVPSPGTFFQHAWKVPPGHLCAFALNDLPATPRFAAFATRFRPATLPGSLGEWEEALRHGLRAAVQRQLMADVPLASLLSGGVDSSVVTGLMRELLPQPPQAFAVGLADAPDGGELAVARRAASALEVPLSELEVTHEDYLHALPNQVGALAEPIANAGVLLLGMLCRRVRETHKVVLTGQGADEPLGGYPRHTAQRLYPLARRLAPLLNRLPEAWAMSDRMARMRRVAAEPDEARRFTQILAVFGPLEAARLTGHRLSPDWYAEPVRRWLPPNGDGDAVNRLLRVDTRLSLADDLLLVADHTSMASAVELRVPFLDLEFLALVERMPGRLKVSRWGERKWLYRRGARQLLPRAVRRSLVGWRARTGRKEGFTTPMDDWLHHWVQRDAQTFLLGPEARTPAYLASGGVAGVLADVRDGGRSRNRQVLALYVLETWLRRTLS
jgi:asparagine synthase (glutamine-hydrolysing)